MILLTGATGKTGGETARQLAAAGRPFRALVRNPGKAAGLQSMGAELVIGDVDDVDALREAFAGVDKALLVLPNVERQLTLEKRFTDEAVRAGIKNLVYLSSLESVPESTNPITQNHVAAENYIRESGLTYTLIRPTFFMQIFEGMAPRIKATGTITMPAGNGTVACTDLRDVAAVIVKVFTEPGHENQSYDLTGPELMTFGEIAKQFSAVLGRPIQYVDQPLEEFKDVLRSINMSDWRTEAVGLEFVAIANGAIDHTTDTIEKLLGRPPTSLEQFLRDKIDLFT